MIAYASTRLAALFGTPLQYLTAADVVRALASGTIREDEDLDFKERYPFKENPDVAKAEFAKDLAALANTRGGALLLGVRDAQGVGGACVPQDVSEKVLRDLRQYAASWVFPVVPFGVEPLLMEGENGKGLCLITVPRSPSAPHGVRHPDDKDYLRFPYRAGADTRYMTESQLADAYRSRMRDAAAQDARLEAVGREGRARLSRHRLWLTLVFVPNARGDMALSQRRLEQLSEWVQQRPVFEPFEKLLARPLVVTTRARRAVVARAPTAGAPGVEADIAELHTDGAGFCAVPIASHKLNVAGGSVQITPQDLDADRLVAAAVQVAGLLADHARSNVGLVGDAVAELRVENERSSAGAGGSGSSSGRGPVRIVRFDAAAASLMPYPDSREVAVPPTSQRTVSIEHLAASPTEQLAAARLLLLDVFAEAGVPEVPHVSPDGSVRIEAWNPAHRDAVRRWAEANGARVG